MKQGGVPASISATFYKLEHKYWFTLSMWMTALLLMPVAIEVSSQDTMFMAFLACAGMLFVGAAPEFRNEKIEHDIHMYGAVICVAGSQLWVAFNLWWILSLWAVYVVGTGIYMTRVEGKFKEKFLATKPMFWVEIVALVATYTAVLIRVV